MTSLFESVLRISIEAALLVLLVLGARLIVSRRPGVMLTVLYVLIAVRLAVPLAISSPLSIQNIVQQAPIEMINSFPAHEAASDAADSLPEMEFVNSSYTPVQPSQENHTMSDNSTLSPAAAQPSAMPLSAMDIAAIIWITGMAVFAGAMLTGNLLFMRRIKRNRAYESPAFTALLTECKKMLHLNKNIRAVCATETGTAAVYGVFRPVLLISPSSFEALTEAQQRHVLLHELSHIRRRDNLVCAGATVLNVIHWFNPLVWIVFALMRRDIEVQCDAHVFRGLPGAERADYAGTLLKLAGPVQTPRLAPALFISKANIKRRIVMVIKHRNKSALFTVIALILTVVVAVTGCTTAVDQTNEVTSPEPTESARVEEMTATPPPVESESVMPIAEPELMASFTVNNSKHDNVNQMENIRIAADLLNGIVIRPGETISLNELLGPRNRTAAEAVGWKDAAGITGDAFALQVGGGVSAVSTALYNAAIRAELEIVEMVHHTIPPDYIDAGLDATVSTAGPDLKIKNPYDTDVTIKAELDEVLLTVSVYGPPMNYTIDFHSEKATTDAELPEIRYVYNTDTTPDGTKIAPGESYEFCRPRVGQTVNVYKTRYDLDGNEIDTTLYEKIIYRPFIGIVYVNGPDPNSGSASSGSSETAAEPAPTPTPKPTSAPSSELGSEAKQ